jgi:DNA polymerase
MKQKLIEKLLKELELKANSLPLVKSSKDIVPPEGNFQAELFFIGEAAGFHEHRLRRPFVGAAGKLLTTVLEENGWQREDVWITNVVKARPPENRDPKPEEIEAYKYYLDKEIEIIEPKIIVTLGRHSMGKFILNAYISNIHGQPRWVDWHEKRILIFPMFHPAAALRNGQVMQSFKQDFAKLRQTYEIITNKQKVDDNLREDLYENDKQNNEPNESEQLQLIK